jgi:hypothetical protein
MVVFGLWVFTLTPGYEMKGFAESRDYYATVFDAEVDDGLEGLWDALADAQVERTVLERPECEVQHGYVWSAQRFASPEKLIRDEGRSTNAESVYRYDLYTLRCTTERGILYVVAFPFRRLGRHVLSQIAESVGTSNLFFCSIDIKKLVAAVGEDRHKAGDIRIVGYDVHVTPDPKVTELILRGEDPIHSPIFEWLQERLPARALMPRTCVLVHEDSKIPRLRLHCDRFGNYRFYLKRRAENLKTLRETLEYMENEGLIRRTRTSPFLRTLLEEDEDDGITESS